MTIRNLIVSVDELDTVEKFRLAVDCYRSARLPLAPMDLLQFGRRKTNDYVGMGNFYVGFIPLMEGRTVVSLETLAALAQPKKKRRIAGITEMILAQPVTLTNRQVADRLGIDLTIVKTARRNHSVVYAKTARDKGLKDKILACSPSASSYEVARALGCSPRYVRMVRNG
jgi:DNA-binding CsgD family transcriptional regulator